MTMIPEPIKGESVKLSWGIAVTRSINEMTPFASPGMLQRSGAGGFGFSPLPVNQRNRTSAMPRPWTFVPNQKQNDSKSSTGDEEEIFGWINCIIQIGYAIYQGDSPASANEYWPKSLSLTIENITTTDDGDHYLKLDLNEKKYEIVVVGEGEDPPKSELEKDIIVIWIGHIKEGKQEAGIWQMPIIYTYA